MRPMLTLRASQYMLKWEEQGKSGTFDINNDVQVSSLALQWTVSGSRNITRIRHSIKELHPLRFIPIGAWWCAISTNTQQLIAVSSKVRITRASDRYARKHRRIINAYDPSQNNCLLQLYYSPYLIPVFKLSSNLISRRANYWPLSTLHVHRCILTVLFFLLLKVLVFWPE